MAFVEFSLLSANGLTHHGGHVAEDEELTPTLENFVVLTWLRLIHPSLPRLVKQRYGTELRSRTLASIKPEISQALRSLLEEIRASDDAKTLRAAVADDFRRPRPGGRSDPKTRPRQPRQDKVCPLCKQAGRSNTNHFLSQCTFLPDNDRRFMVKARQIVGILDDEQDTNYDLDPDPPCPETTLPTPDVVALPCPDPSISLYGCLSWSPCRTYHHRQRSNWKYDPSLHHETSWTSSYLKCSVRPAGRWLFSASGDRRDTDILHPRQHRLCIRVTCRRGSWRRSACRDPFHGGKRRRPAKI